MLMRGSIVGLIFLAALGSCGTQESTPSAEELARNTIKAVINPVISNQFKGVNAEVITDCIIDNASTSEIVEIANSALLGSSKDSLYVILPIVQRPETLNCMAAGALKLAY